MVPGLTMLRMWKVQQEIRTYIHDSIFIMNLTWYRKDMFITIHKSRNELVSPYFLFLLSYVRYPHIFIWHFFHFFPFRFSSNLFLVGRWCVHLYKKKNQLYDCRKFNLILFSSHLMYCQLSFLWESGRRSKFNWNNKKDFFVLMMQNITNGSIT